MSKRYTANRSIYKQPKPPEIPDPPKGYGYVGTGIPNSPLIKGDAMIARRLTPKGHPLPDSGCVHDVWTSSNRRGVINTSHYAIPMDIWNEIDFPPETH